MMAVELVVVGLIVVLVAMLARRAWVISADFRAARSALLFRVCVVEAVAAPPGHGGVGEVGCA